MVNLAFIGLGSGNGDLDALNRGKRRMVTYLTFVVFVLITAACTANDWVKGGLENTWTTQAVAPLAEPFAPVARSLAGEGEPLATGARMAQLEAAVAAVEEGAEAHGRALQTTRTFKQYFHVGLLQVMTATSYTSRYTGNTVQYSSTYDTSDFISELNAAAVATNCTPGSLRNIFCGLQPIPYSKFSATYGLLVFAALLQCAAWLLMAAVQNETSVVVNWKWTMALIGGLQLGAAFFTVVALSVFGSAGIKDEFCKAFDPDANYNGLPCGYNGGYAIAGVAVGFSLLQVLLFWGWMPHGAVAGKYAFSASAAGMGSGGGAKGYGEIGAAEGAAAPSASLTASAYQDIGTSA